MKKLLLIRHAKSSWDNSLQPDFERPLNDRGKKDAPEMAKRLLNKNIVIDAFISSTANRAFATAQYFAKEYKVSTQEIIAHQTLYHAPPSIIGNIIEQTDDSLNCIAIFCHNPGITNFVNMLTNVRVDNVPTCGIFAVTINTKKWKHFMDAPIHFLFFDYPKALR